MSGQPSNAPSSPEWNTWQLGDSLATRYGKSFESEDDEDDDFDEDEYDDDDAAEYPNDLPVPFPFELAAESPECRDGRTKC